MWPLSVGTAAGMRWNKSREREPLITPCNTRHFQKWRPNTGCPGRAAAICPCMDNPPQLMHKLSQKGVSVLPPARAMQPQLTSKRAASMVDHVLAGRADNLCNSCGSPTASPTDRMAAANITNPHILNRAWQVSVTTCAAPRGGARRVGDVVV